MWEIFADGSPRCSMCLGEAGPELTPPGWPLAPMRSLNRFRSALVNTCARIIVNEIILIPTSLSSQNLLQVRSDALDGTHVLCRLELLLSKKHTTTRMMNNMDLSPRPIRSTHIGNIYSLTDHDLPTSVLTPGVPLAQEYCLFAPVGRQSKQLRLRPRPSDFATLSASCETHTP